MSRYIAVWSLKSGPMHVEMDTPEQRTDATHHIDRILGLRIALIRQAEKLNQSQVAAMLNVHRNTISRWETGENPMPAAYLYLFCCKMDVSPMTILKLITFPEQRKPPESATC